MTKALAPTGVNARAAAFGLLSLWLVSCNTAAIKHSYMSLDQDGDRKRTVFYTDTDKIYCIGELAIGRKDISIAAALRSISLAPPPSGSSVPLASTLASKDVSPSSTGSDVVVSFELIKPDMKAPWPAGDFACDLSIDGELSASVPFQIAYPDCPVQPPLDGDSCAGFFLPHSVCVGAITAQSCECSSAGSWQCR